MCIIWPFWHPKVKCASDWKSMLPIQVPCILHKFYTNATITFSTNVFLDGHTPLKQNLYAIQCNHMDSIVLKGGKLLITNNMTSSKKLLCNLFKQITKNMINVMYGLFMANSHSRISYGCQLHFLHTLKTWFHALPLHVFLLVIMSLASGNQSKFCKTWFVELWS